MVTVTIKIISGYLPKPTPPDVIEKLYKVMDETVERFNFGITHGYSMAFGASISSGYPFDPDLEIVRARIESGGLVGVTIDEDHRLIGVKFITPKGVNIPKTESE